MSETVEEAWETKPLEKVVRPVTSKTEVKVVRAPDTVNVPKLAIDA